MSSTFITRAIELTHFQYGGWRPSWITSKVTFDARTAFAVILLHGKDLLRLGC